MYDNMIFANNLNTYLNLANIDQKDLAKAIRVTPSSVSLWTKGENIPRLDKIEAIATYFGITVSDLISRKSDDPLERELLFFFRSADEATKRKIVELVKITAK